MFELNEPVVEFLVSQSVIPSKSESNREPVDFVHGENEGEGE